MLNVAYAMPAAISVNGGGTTADIKEAPTSPGNSKPRQHQQQQQTNSELYELRQSRQRDKREEVTWETSSYDRDRGRMVRSLNVVERNRLEETKRQLRREMEQRLRDIRQEQTAVKLVRHHQASSSSHQDLRSCGGGDNSGRSHSGSYSYPGSQSRARFC